MEIVIERAAIADAPAILALQRLAYLSEAAFYNDYNIAPLTQTLRELEAEFSTHTILVARLKAKHDGGRIVGTVRSKISNGRCLIARLAVDPSHQRQGVATRLMAAIEAAFPDVEFFELFTGYRSEGNLRLYHGLGYRDFKQEKVSPTVQFVFMEKRNRP